MNELPPEPFHYVIPHNPLTLTFSSYGHYLDKDILLSLLQHAYRDASLEIMAEGPGAYIGPGHHVYTNSAVGIMFYLSAENLHMCWIFFREAMEGMRQVVGHFGGEELEFEVEHHVWGLVATGAFKGL
ncbi:hypothetical protein OEA41_010877 [Lepraria neglecta]|uniref:Uncharacterized protein n=1 Tax=Lepraria neglecta TaxID=209136 RepID=A0AAD9YZQ7_9LECA|nr:hypothetical protein OEA41_010877 [Lepraria neglecta]